MKKFAVLFPVLLSFIIAACSEQSTAPDLQSNVNEAVIMQKTTDMSASSDFQILKTLRDDGTAWEVTVKMPNGGKIKIEYTASGSIREVKSLNGPYDYEFKPGNGSINYSAARANALKAVPGTITFWKYGKDESDNRFEYRFDISKNGKRFEVRLNAASGAVTRIKD